MLSKNRSLRHKLLSGAGLLTILLGAAAVEPANATPSVSFAVSETPGIGSLTVQGSSATGAGSFTIATPHFGGTASFLGSPLLIQPTFDTNTLSVSTTTGGTLYVYLTEQGLTAPLGIANFLSSFTANTFTGGAVNVIEKTFVSTTNALWTGTALGTQTFTSIGSTAMLNGTPSLSAPYSETAEFIINIVGAGSENDTINIADPAPAVPEPMSMAILGTALCSLGIIRRRKVARA